jgi:aspartate aminotransferase
MAAESLPPSSTLRPSVHNGIIRRQTTTPCPQPFFLFRLYLLKDPEFLGDRRLGELKTMADRVLKMRQALYDALIECKAPGTWEHILNQRGLFTYSGLTGTLLNRLEFVF